MKNARKWIVTVLVIVVLLGGVLAVWRPWQQPQEPDDSGWVNAQSGINRGTLSEFGYYYLEDSTLTFYDFATGVNVKLCSRVACSHDSEECDGYISSLSPMVFQNDCLYYIESDFYGLHLYRRNAVGEELLTVGSIGTRFIEEQKSVEVKSWVPSGNYLYYAASVVGNAAEDGYSTTKTERYYIGRIHLTTGKDEVLIEQEAGSASMELLAVQSGSILFRREGTVDVDYSDPEYQNKLSQVPVTLELRDGETEEITELFRKSRSECISIFMVYGNKVYYPVKFDYTEISRGVTHAFDISTGEETQVAENATYRYLGGGYALRQVGYEEDWHLYDLKTEEALPYTLPEIAHSYCIGKAGAVIRYSIKRGDYSGTECSYVPYRAMSDGLQEADLQPVFALMNTHPDTPSTPTTPTQPNDSENEYPPISFDNYPPVSDEELDPRIQYLPETVDNPQNLPVLKWVYFHLYSWDFTEDAVHELNQMLADRNMPFRIQFIVLSSGSYTYGPEADWFSRAITQEALNDADLICGYMYPDERQKYLMPITDYVTGDAQPSLKNSVLHNSYWIQEDDGNIYGIPTSIGYDQCGGWHVDAEVFEKFGLTEKDFQKNFWEMDEVFAKLYQANGNKPFLYLNYESDLSYPYIEDNGEGPDIALPGDFSWEIANFYQYIGAYYGIDFSTGTPTVVNTLETNAIRSMQSAVMRYLKAGYITRGNNSLEVSLLTFTGCKSDTSYYQESTDEVVIPVTPMIQSLNHTKGTFNGVTAVSQHKKEALMLLNLIAEDSEFRDQLLFGKEGRDYKIVDGEYATIKNENGERYNMAHLSYMLSYCSPIKESEAKRFFLVREGQTIWEAMAENADCTVWHYCPIEFDYSGFEAELEQIGKIIGKYYRFLTNTQDREFYHHEFGHLFFPEMTEELYDQMLQELNDAGSDKIVAELQRQLDEWLANNPDWQ